MEKYCLVYECNSSYATNSDLSFFHYPKEDKLLKAWICKVRLENFTLTSTSYFVQNILLQQILQPQTLPHQRRSGENTSPKLQFLVLISEEREMKLKVAQLALQKEKSCLVYSSKKIQAWMPFCLKMQTKRVLVAKYASRPNQALLKCLKLTRFKEKLKKWRKIILDLEILQPSKSSSTRG